MPTSRAPGSGLSTETVRIACNPCRKTKLKCSRERPACSNCRKGGYECVYEPKRHKPGIRAGAIETIYKRLSALEHAVFESSHPLSGHQKISQQTPQSGNIEHGTEEDVASEDSPSPSSPRATAGGMIQVDLNSSSHQPFSNYSQQLPPGIGHGTEEQQEGEEEEEEEDDDEPYPQLPPLQSIEVIVTLYFSHVHPWIPMLNQDRFRSRLRHPVELQRLAVILHAMYVSVHRYLPSTSLEVYDSEWPVARLRRWTVATAMDDLSIQGLQALIIIAYEDIGSGNESKAWSIIASLTRTVEYCQLTTEPADRGHRRQPICRPFSYLEPPRDWTDQEEGRRVFWNVFVLDRFCSLSMGWNISLTSMDVRRRLPSDGIMWRRQEPVVTPYLGVWDKSTSGSSSSSNKNSESMSAAMTSGRPTSPSCEVSCDAAIENDHRQTPAAALSKTSSEVDMSKVGQFAYCVEATESMSRVTNYLLQQRFDPNSPKEVEWWLTRFKELDLRLAHWKRLLPQKWKTSAATTTPPEGASRQAPVKLDPNLTLAHVTHNASTILLHQLIAYPPPSWPFHRRLPSVWSAETCCSAASEICTITQQYLRGSGTNADDARPVTSQYAFCVYIAARMMLLHWRHYRDGEDPAQAGGGGGGGAELHSDFWPLVACLEEMAKRWRGGHQQQHNHRQKQVLAEKYASKLRELWGLCSQDETFRMDVTGYTREIEHRQTPVSRHRHRLGHRRLRGGPRSSSYSHSPSWTTTTESRVPQRQWSAAGLDMDGMPPYSTLETHAPQGSMTTVTGSVAYHPPRRESTSYGGIMPAPQPDHQFGFGMAMEGSMNIDTEYFMNLDRVITFGDGGLFTSNDMDGSSW